MRPPLPACQRNDAREAFKIAVGSHERMLRECLYLSHDEYAGTLKSRIVSGLAVKGIDASELDGVVTRCIELVLRKGAE